MTVHNCPSFERGGTATSTTINIHYLPTSLPLNDFPNPPPLLRHSLDNFLSKHIPEARKRLALPLQVHIISLHRLDHFPSVDVWVATLVYVVDDFGR